MTPVFMYSSANSRQLLSAAALSVALYLVDISKEVELVQMRFGGARESKEYVEIEVVERDFVKRESIER